MTKKFKLGDEVVMTKSCSDFLLKNALEIYSNPSTGQLAKDHFEELSCVLWSVHNNKKLHGVVYAVHNDTMYVIFENEVGLFSGYYGDKDIKKIGGKNGKKSVKKA